MYRAYVTRASSSKSDNSPVLARVLQLRSELAAILGYPTYAEYSLANKVAPDVPTVQGFLETLLSHALPAAKRELAELTAYAQSNGHVGPLLQWDISYWSERLKQHLFGYDAEEVRRYFTVPSVLKGLKSLCENVFGVTFQQVKSYRRPTALAARDALSVAVWHSSVKAFLVGEVQSDDDDRASGVTASMDRQLLRDSELDDSDVPSDDSDVQRLTQSKRMGDTAAVEQEEEDDDDDLPILPSGLLYFDPFSRPKEKNQGAWVDDCVPRRLLPPDATGHRLLQMPAAYIVCNIAPPATSAIASDVGKAALMTFRDVETLFHEFGHAAHHVLTTVDYPFVAGMACSCFSFGYQSRLSCFSSRSACWLSDRWHSAYCDMYRAQRRGMGCS